LSADRADVRAILAASALDLPPASIYAGADMSLTKRAFTIATATVLLSLFAGAAVAPALATATPCAVKVSALDGVLHLKLLTKHPLTFDEMLNDNGKRVPDTRYVCDYAVSQKVQGVPLDQVRVSLETPYPPEKFAREEKLITARVNALSSDGGYIYKAPGGGGEAHRAPEYYCYAFAHEKLLVVNVSGKGITLAKASSLLVAVVKQLKL
jgi:hypothetical protein